MLDVIQSPRGVTGRADVGGILWEKADDKRNSVERQRRVDRGLRVSPQIKAIKPDRNGD
jgi:hypothetical protein